MGRSGKYADVGGPGLKVARYSKLVASYLLGHLSNVNSPVERIRDEASKLSDEERADLAQFLIRSLERDSDIEFQTEWDAELEKRGEEIRSGRVTGIPEDEVFARLRNAAEHR